MSRKRYQQLNQRHALAERLAATRIPRSRRQVLSGRGARSAGGLDNFKTPFIAPEDWHEPRSDAAGQYRIVVQDPGRGHRHVVTPDEIRRRLEQAPREIVRPLEVVQLSSLTRKKKLFSCYGMQWGHAVYLYPMPAELIEEVRRPPLPREVTEAAMYGGRWEPARDGCWRLVWTEQAVKDYYLNNILFHELGHLHDRRNRRPADRERFAEWFAIRYGYQSGLRATAGQARPVRRRHHAG
jgi:hypothetical protein